VEKNINICPDGDLLQQVTILSQMKIPNGAAYTPVWSKLT